MHGHVCFVSPTRMILPRNGGPGSSLFRPAIALSLLTLMIGCGPYARSSEGLGTSRLDSLFSAVPNAGFEWSMAEGVSERAAMRVPVDLDGVKGWFQVDTGLDVTILYGDTARRLGWESVDGTFRVPGVRFGDMDLGPVWMRTREDLPAEGRLIGSLGLDLLIGSVVVIDYPGRRLAILRHGDVPGWLWQKTSWTPAAVRDAKLFLYAVLGDEGIGDLVFDTGSSSFDIILDLDDWVHFTGVENPDEAPIIKKVASWGDEVTAIGAPARGPLTIGSSHLPEPRIFFLKEQPNLFSGWPFPARGLVGNAAFWDRVVVLDLGIRPRFGLLAPAID